MTNELIDGYINRIWREFQSVGITDDLTIIENTSFLIVVKHADLWDELKYGSSPSLFQPNTPEEAIKELQYRLISYYSLRNEQLLPSPPVSLSSDKLQSVIVSLEAIYELISLPDFFNHCLVFRLSYMLPGGRYPTPRHITQAMVNLIDIKPGMTLLDLACGSGGLLVAGNAIRTEMTGVEISPNWARLAWVNLILHEKKNPEILIGNALNVFDYWSADHQFDRVVMAPPFGEVVDRSLQIALPHESRMGIRSETVLTTLALRKLSSGGKIIVLLPAGSLFASSSGELFLREMLLRDYSVDAIIALPQDALQPYSSVSSYLLVANKPLERKSEQTRSTWFYTVNNDGFTAGRNREQDTKNSELPRLEATVLAQSTKPELISTVNDTPILALSTIKINNTMAGYSVSKLAGDLFTVKRLYNLNTHALGLLFSARFLQFTASLLVYRDRLYTGSTSSQQLTPRFSRSTTYTGQFSLVTESDSKPTLAITSSDRTLTVKQGKAVDLSLDSEFQETTAIFVIMDLEGQVITSPLYAPLDKLPSELAPTSAIAFSLENAQEQIAGYLVILVEEPLNTTMFNSKRNSIYLMEIDNGYLIIESGGQDSMISKMHFLNATPTFTAEKYHIGVVVDTYGEYFGVEVGFNDIANNRFNLQPNIYFPHKDLGEAKQSPAQLLADIKEKHRRLEQHIDYLLGIVELQYTNSRLFPAPMISNLKPFGRLNSIQQAIWNQVLSMKDKVEAYHDESYFVPRPFQTRDISSELPLDDIESTLELFEKMGLIVRIMIEGAPYYRCVMESDLRSEGEI